ncbi:MULTISPECIES: MFS transporter [Enterococcus]|uniref:Major facilitator superfamily (MFS) profile domain-containing protein n=1 Tax=Enterococcus sulfureus ATCC 49903 TaxID=1140003 RepID=S0KXP7_9ENTE|nr:MFS transporter [Enterococcus sulfureus]EOT49554.1 hypothetical protein OMY_00482 [Enterococcus sulfureus ATCC 49903]EOT87421.1 hypothetical protein I573_00477 [Enterococcus sulfureus ATCC 49903]
MEQTKTNHAALTLFALAISAFGIGSTEFISVGLLPLIKEDFGVSLNQAGLTVSIYALGVTIGAPILTALTSRLAKKQILLLVMTVFILGNLIAAFAPIFSLLLVGRIIASFAHGVFMSVASVIAAEVVMPDKRASAISIMFTGLTVATVTGVPLGTFIGQAINWRWSFLFIAGIGIIGWLANFLLVPSTLTKSQAISLADSLAVLKNKQMLLILLLTAIGYGGTFTVYTFITPILESYFGYSSQASVIILVIYGLFVALGNTLGGKWANQQPLRFIFYAFIGLSISLLLLFLFINNRMLGLGAVLLMGLFMFMSVPGLQLYAVIIAEREVPQATAMASALNISAFNVGIFLGSTIGGQVVATQSLSYTPLYGFVMVVVASIIAKIWSEKIA